MRAGRGSGGEGAAEETAVVCNSEKGQKTTTKSERERERWKGSGAAFQFPCLLFVSEDAVGELR